MKLEKRSDPSSAGAAEEPVEQDGGRGKKPVVVYIMILFIAAFLMMAWSFASHQRSNTEALGRLQSSVGAMQEVQELQEQIIQLQKELSAAEKRVEELESEAEYRQSVQETRDQQTQGMSLLYRLQQQYAAQDYDACRETIAEFDGGGYAELLPQLSGEGVTPPAERYQQLKEAVEARLAETDGAAS